MVYGIHVPVAKPGPYLVRAALRDPATEGSGSAQQFVEVPDVENGHLAVSGIVLQEDIPEAAAKSPQDAAPDAPSPGEDATSGAARRSFHRGFRLLYAYQIIERRAPRPGVPGPHVPRWTAGGGQHDYFRRRPLTRPLKTGSPRKATWCSAAAWRPANTCCR